MGTGFSQEVSGGISLDEIKSSLSGGDADSAEQYFQHANAAFNAGDLGKALTYYEALAQTGWVSDSLFLNLGVAHFRNQSPGRAALWFRRAAHLNPGMPEIRQNFEFLRSNSGLIEFTSNEWQRALARLQPGTLHWFSWLAFWLGAFSLYLATSGKKKSLAPVFAVVCAFAIAGSVIGFSLHQYREKRLAPENYATVIVDGTSALTAPAPDSKPVIALPEGSEVRIITHTGPWIYAAVPGDAVGWVHHTSVEPNWPITVPHSGSLQVSAP